MSDSFDKVEYTVRLQDAWIPSYPAVYNLFLGAGSNAVNETTRDDMDQATISFQTVETLGDVKAKPISEESTEIARLKSGTKTKQYNKFLSGIAWKKKGLKPTYDNFASVSGQALNKILMQEDKEFLTGRDGNGVVQNNGLFTSQDPNFITETTQGAVPATLSAIKSAFDADLDIIRKDVSGIKYVLAWGAMKTALTTFPSEESVRTKQDIIQSSISDIRFINTISDITAGSSEDDIGLGGYIIVTPSAVRLHHGLLTQILGLGYNEEETRIWMNIGFTSKSLEVLARNGVLKRIWKN